MTLSAWRAWVQDEGTRAKQLLHDAQDPFKGTEHEGLGGWMHTMADLRFDMQDWLWARAIALSRAYLMVSEAKRQPWASFERC
jgi:hypothetical protein